MNESDRVSVELHYPWICRFADRVARHCLRCFHPEILPSGLPVSTVCWGNMSCPRAVRSGVFAWPNMIILKGKFVHVLNYALRHDGVWGSGCIEPHFLVLSSSCRWMASFKPLPLPTGSNGYQIGLTRKTVWTICGSDISWPYWDWNLETKVIQPVASHYTDCVTGSLHLKTVVARTVGKVPCNCFLATTCKLYTSLSLR
jgi:hypothetical protein